MGGRDLGARRRGGGAEAGAQEWGARAGLRGRGRGAGAHGRGIKERGRRGGGGNLAGHACQLSIISCDH